MAGKHGGVFPAIFKIWMYDGRQSLPYSRYGAAQLLKEQAASEVKLSIS